MKDRILMTAALASIIVLGACNAGAPSAPNAVVTSNTTGISNDLAIEAPPIAIGEVGSAPGIDFAILSLERVAQIGSDSFGKKVEQNETYLVVKYSMKNTSSQPLLADERPTISLVDASGQTYIDDRAAGLQAGGMGGAFEDLNPNMSAKAAIVWKVDSAKFDQFAWQVVLATEPTLRFSLG